MFLAKKTIKKNKLLKEYFDKGSAPPKDNYHVLQKSPHQQALRVLQPTTSIQQNTKTQIEKDVDKQSTAVSSNIQERSVYDKEEKINNLTNSETHAYCQEKDVDKQITESCQDVSEIKSNSEFGMNLSEDKQQIQRWNQLFKQSSQLLSIGSIISQQLGMKSYIIFKIQCFWQLMKRDLVDNYWYGVSRIGNKKISYLKVDVREEKTAYFEKLYPQGTASEQGYKIYELKQQISCPKMDNSDLLKDIDMQFGRFCRATEKCISILNMERACDVYCFLDQFNFWPK